MAVHTTDFKTPGEFAKEYTRTKGISKGSKGVSRAYINKLVQSEIQQPGSTGLDVMVIPTADHSMYLVRYSLTDTSDPIRDIIQDVISKA